MTDVLKIALNRRAELHDEVARIDEFIRMADVLLNEMHGHDERPEAAARGLRLPRELQEAFRELPIVMPSEVATGEAAGVAAGITRMNLMRRRPVSVSG